MDKSTMRLGQVSRKLNIGRDTIITFLQKKGFDIDSNPNAKINVELYKLSFSQSNSPCALHYIIIVECCMKIELANKIILQPYITEKTFELVETEKKICFIVERTASKSTIKNAINTLYEQKALAVNTARTIYGKKAFVEFETVDVARDLATKIGML